MNTLALVQILTTTACALAAALNLQQMLKWRRRYTSIRPVCQVVEHVDASGEKRVVIRGNLPPVGTMLYVNGDGPITRDITVGA
jgi:hypothetical protein